LSVVAELENQDGQLRPGLFVQADLTIESGAQVLSVPASAVVTHEQESFVFVQEKIGTYRRVNVQIGRQTDEWVEVVSGLTTGDPVVVHGSFVLKSELLLEPEE
jgi:multidrug efflux pump subunit AcrA (membrane-fusion protein)